MGLERGSAAAPVRLGAAVGPRRHDAAIGQVHGKIASHVQPGQMRILDEPVRFTIHDATVASA
mgnify:CR=1 FL=1